MAKRFLKINKYLLVSLLFFIITFVVGDSNLYKRYTYDEKIRDLEREIKEHQKEILFNQKKLEDLHDSKERLERYAREEFFMKAPNEDLFIIAEK